MEKEREKRGRGKYFYKGIDIPLGRGLLIFDVRIGAGEGLWRTFDFGFLNYTRLFKLRALDIFTLDLPFIGFEVSYEWGERKGKRG